MSTAETQPERVSICSAAAAGTVKRRPLPHRPYARWGRMGASVIISGMLILHDGGQTGEGVYYSRGLAVIRAYWNSGVRTRTPLVCLMYDVCSSRGPGMLRMWPGA